MMKDGECWQGMKKATKNNMGVRKAHKKHQGC
jgi:hypothetical protein